jgi:alpha-L-glutamate ligase-like protein
LIWNRYRALRRNGVLGINERNIHYINALNPRKLIRLVDDKIETKRLALAAGIPSPELYGYVANARDMRALPEMMRHPDGFVIKPTHGSQGNGIVVIEGPLQNDWRLASGRRINLDTIKFHINNILSGMYSLGAQPDTAMLEYRVKFDDVFARVSFKGVPDIRIIVVKGFPVAGMVRLPTSESDGKANLHKGGLGVGLSMATGITRTAMQYDRQIDLHPDTANPLNGIEVPYWDDMLLMASRSYDVTGLGYLGVDIVLDRDKGPMLLELNARPGISIQNANRFGLRDRLRQALALADDSLDAAARVRIAKQLYRRAEPEIAPEQDALVATG